MEKRTPKHHSIPTILFHVITLKSYNSMQLVPVPSQTKAVHILPTYLFMINIDIVLHAKLMFMKWSRFFRFPHQNPESISLTACVHRDNLSINKQEG